jgi:hypothetical protein
MMEMRKNKNSCLVDQNKSTNGRNCKESVLPELNPGERYCKKSINPSLKSPDFFQTR